MTVDPFLIDVPAADLRDLHARLDRTRWPERETVDGWEQGIPLDVVRDLCAYWRHGYDWPSRQRVLNRHPQVRTEIDGLTVHAVHARSARPDAVPLLLTHGWPGCFTEYLGLVEELTAPPDGAPAFHVVLPSLPGYGFSGRPSAPGWDVTRTARAWVTLMERLGYDRFGAGGSDWGTSVSSSLGAQFPDRVIGLQLIPPLAGPAPGDDPTPAEQALLDDLAAAGRRSGYGEMQAATPQTTGYALLDSPAALCAWIVEKFWLWTDRAGDRDLYEVIDRDRLLDVVSVYWFTGTGASAARMYWESFDYVRTVFAGGLPDRVDVPVGASLFPAEVPLTSRRWAGRRFTDIRQWHDLPAGGHFAALEQPGLVVSELRSFFGSLGS